MISKMQLVFRNINSIRIFLVLFYLIGVIGLVVPSSSSTFIQLTSFTLIMSFGLLMLHHQSGFGAKTIMVFASVFMAGIVVEMIGVQTGMVFGNYVYGAGLGLKIYDTPLLIGMNWLLLIYTTATIVQGFNISKTLQVVAGASMMVVYDIVLEQVAPKMDMWSWFNNLVPYSNYISWWLVAASFHALIVLTSIKIKNPLSIVVLVVQFIFFVALYLFM